MTCTDISRRSVFRKLFGKYFLQKGSSSPPTLSLAFFHCNSYIHKDNYHIHGHFPVHFYWNFCYMPQAGSVLERWRDLCTHSPKGREEQASISMGWWLGWFDQSQVPVGAQPVKNLPAMQKTWVQSLGQEHPLEKGMETHSSILAWRIPWTEEPGGLQSMGS